MIQVCLLPSGAPKITEVTVTKKKKKKEKQQKNPTTHTSLSCRTEKRVQTRPGWFSYQINLAAGAEVPGSALILS